ncbi:hypothetical protein BECAL_02966 [Bellilinea caldifistulae]|uniref:Uncharacterized protein n=1 Tax=Bellilinea caldifistulae TaxID=360411 RepID=A0A0P6XQI2_9CHLR|nr:hypothetical protein [Bellilinea caldifistulae]KPL74561.1 hypothetical protein AC812_12255 [Bellilinea caldifistulae]GAP11773.1 hypothetical protein BECAL_02966 [Bellilinea caldifistulae]
MKYDEIIEKMPPGLERAILRVLESRRGRRNAIGRNELTAMVRRLGQPASERQVREMIKQLRRKGYLICSAPGEDGGYYWADTLEEYQEFRKMEFAAKIADMSETLRAMDQSAERIFGDSFQMRLL